MSKNILKKLFMAVKIGQKAEESLSEIKRYTGYASVKVLAVNPNKAWIKEHTGRELTEEPSYVSTNDQGKKTLRLDFYVQTDATMTNGLEIIHPLTFFLSETVQSTKDNTKVRVIDNYGEVAWVTKEEYQQGIAPTTSRVQGKYKVCHQDEEKLMSFLKAWLNVSDSTTWDANQRIWKPVEHMDECECAINFDKLVKGDVSELRQYVAAAEDYLVKVLFGIRHVDNKHYMTICNNIFLKNSSRNYQRFQKEMDRMKANGAYATTDFSYVPLHEWTIESTTFTPNSTAVPSTDDIFGNLPETPQLKPQPKTTFTPESAVDVTNPNDDLPF